MKDFDFEELDKAVNGLLNSATDEKEAPVETIATPEPVTRPLPTTPIERPASITPAARRTASGRFMDMVHPSSDMRNKTTPVEAEPATSTQPEPLPTSRPVTEPTRETIPAPEEKPTPPLPEIDSPFLPDTKVEKRPLGGVTPVAEAPLIEQINDAPVPEDTSPQEPEEPAHSEVPVETQPQERNYTDEDRVASDIASIEHEVLPSEAHTDVVEEVSVPVEPSAPTSITQQYEETPATTPQESGAIYDTEAYHQPFAQAPKTGGNLWLILLWVGGLLVLGAAAGVAVYLFVLPML